MTRVHRFFVFCPILIAIGCGPKGKGVNPNVDTNSFYSAPSREFIIYEDSSKNIFLNKIPISLYALDSSLKELQAAGGEIFYDCRGSADCPPKPSQAVDLIAKYGFKLNILITKPNYKYTPANKSID